MGIQGLLPLLKSIQQPISISELAGSTVGVDVYCWLHKGAYGCALELAQGNDSELYINYVMRRVNMMLYYKVKPILVFDGGYLPSKSEKEAERRERRRDYKSQGLGHLKNGNRTQAMECFQKSIDITPEMALNVMKVCREKGVDCIVAPYEADAQLAYLMKTGITQCTISEDSDLLVYGCEKVVFKMDANGSGLIIDLKQLPKLKGLRMDGFTQQKFREMCILSGCDYLQSVKGMGLITAHKMLRAHSSVKKLISTLRLNTKMNVPVDYETRFQKAEQTFLYQIVFDPKTNKLVPLNPVPDEINPSHLHFAGHSLKWKQEDAVDLAMGNLNPLTGTKIGDFKLTKVLSSEEDAERSWESENTQSMKASICPQVKKSRSDLSSTKKKYDAEKNLNGTVRETKSSEKANSQFFTPVRNKRSRTSSDEVQQENSKLARLYSTNVEEMTVDIKFETTEQTSELGAKLLSTVQPQLKMRRNNPFRNPVIRKPDEQNVRVVSRYFGLAGMEIIKNEPVSEVTDSGATTNNEELLNELKENRKTEKGETDSQGPTSSQNEFLNCTEQEDGEFQESGYLSSSQTMENSPTDNCNDPEEQAYSPPLQKYSPPLPKIDFSPLPTTNFPTLPKFSTASTSGSNKDRNVVKQKSISGQMSLDRFAFKKEKAINENGKTDAMITTSPKRTALADRSPPNHELDGRFNDSQQDLMKNENRKENCANIFEDNKWANVKSPGTIMARKSKLLGLQSKPTTGLGRCRTVGLSRPRKNSKDSAKKTNNTVAPLLNYFTYRGRDRTSREITEQTGV